MGDIAGLQISSNGKRFGAYVLDSVLAIVTLGIGWFVWSLVVYAKGQTPAKQLMGMRTVRADTGRVASYGAMLLREWVGKGLLGGVTFGITTLVGSIMLLTSDRGESLWDKMASTTIVDDPTGRALTL